MTQSRAVYSVASRVAVVALLLFTMVELGWGFASQIGLGLPDGPLVWPIFISVGGCVSIISCLVLIVAGPGRFWPRMLLVGSLFFLLVMNGCSLVSALTSYNVNWWMVGAFSDFCARSLLGIYLLAVAFDHRAVFSQILIWLWMFASFVKMFIDLALFTFNDSRNWDYDSLFDNLLTVNSWSWWVPTSVFILVLFCCLFGRCRLSVHQTDRPHIVRAQ